MIAGVVLAAGLSRRMGTPKQLLPLGADTLLGHTLRIASRSRLGEIVVVLSPEVHETALLGPSRDLPIVRVLNPVPEQGQSSSLKLGLAAASPRAAGALVLVSDQPGITAELIDRLITTFEHAPSSALVPTYAGRRGTPVLLARSIWPLAQSLSGDTGARALFEAHPELVREVEVGHLGAPDDVDTPEQYERLRARSAAE